MAWWYVEGGRLWVGEKLSVFESLAPLTSHRQKPNGHFNSSTNSDNISLIGQKGWSPINRMLPSTTSIHVPFFPPGNLGTIELEVFVVTLNSSFLF